MQWLATQGPVTAGDLPPDANNMAAWDPNSFAGPPPVFNAPPTMNAPQQGSSAGFHMPSMGGSDMANWAAILGGLGLGLARPRLADDARQNFQAMNTMQWREDQKAFAKQRLDMAQREHDIQVANFLKMQEPEGGATQGTFTAPPPSMASTPQAPASPQASAVPHFAAPQISGLNQPAQFAPEGRMAAPPDQPFFTTPPSPVRGNTSTNLSAFGQSQTRSTNRGTEKEQATNNAVNDLTAAWVQNPDQAQKDPRRLLKEVLQRNPNADSKAVRESISNTLFDTYYSTIQKEQPKLDPKSTYRQAYAATSRDLPGLFAPTDQMRSLSTQSASVEEQRGLATSADDTKRLGQLNTYEQQQAAGLRGAQNAADAATKLYTPGELQQFEQPPIPGTTPLMQSKRGVAPMSEQRKVNVTVSERERVQRQVQLEAVAPSIAHVVQRAEQIRKGFSDLNLMNLAQKGKNWLDVAQSQVTGLPQTELGKLVTSYDDMVQTSGPFMAKAVQGQVGNLTEQEQAVGRQGFPKTFRELVNNPVAGNDRMSVLGTVLAMELRDPTFDLGRLEVPMSEFEKSVRAHRQQLIQTRPELFTNAPQMAPQMPQSAGAPPTLATPPMTPEDQAVSDRIQQELGAYFQANPRRK